MTWPPYPIEMYKMPNILSPPCELLSNKAQAEIFHRNYSEWFQMKEHLTDSYNLFLKYAEKI